MKFLALFFFFCCVSVVYGRATDIVTLSSPDDKYQFIYHEDGTYSINYGNQLIIDKSALGLETNRKAVSTITVRKVKRKSHRSQWKPVYGENNSVYDNYNEALLISNGEDDYNLRVRAYSEGIAFRYEFKTKANFIIHQEHTTFEFPFPDVQAWVSSNAQFPIFQIDLKALTGTVERPLLLKMKDDLFVALGEAALVDYSRTKFTKSKTRNALETVLYGDTDPVQAKRSSWRYVMAAPSPAGLLANNFLLLNLNEPSKIKDTSWIKPGKVLREVTLTTQGGKACIDFAVKHNLQYILFDAGWYGNEYDKQSDATYVSVDPKRSKGPLELQEVIDYGKANNIGVILYVNGIALKQQLDDILPLYQKWGVAGIKYGFVGVGSQENTVWLHEAVGKSSKHNILVNIHDEYRPTGYSRTYPNLLTQEGVRGDEESPTNEQVINTLFTRMIAGAADQTNCYFASRVTEKMGSHASQMAKAICIYSPWQFLYWYDRPQGAPAQAGGAGNANNFIQEIPDLQFFDELETVWDKTLVLDGYPGEFALIARKRHDKWFVGGIAGKVGKKITLKLDFLDRDKTYQATIYTDNDKPSAEEKVAIRTLSVDGSSSLDFEVRKEQGIALVIHPVN